MLAKCGLQTLSAFYNGYYRQCSENEEILLTKPLRAENAKIVLRTESHRAQSNFVAAFVDSSSTLASFAAEPDGSRRGRPFWTSGSDLVCSRSTRSRCLHAKMKYS